MRRVRLAGEEGIALTVAICSLALMITLGGIALNQALSALRQSDDNAHIKRALHAADAAVDAAAYAVSRASLGDTLDIDPQHPETVITQNCVVTVNQVAGLNPAHPDIDLVPLPSVAPDVSGTKWCPESAQHAYTGGASYSFRVSQLLRAGGGSCGGSSLIDLDRYVVGIGRSGGKVRRVKARLTASIQLRSGAAVQSSSSNQPLLMTGSAKVLGDVESNGNITGTLTNLIVGNATYGPGKNLTGVVPTGGSGEACRPFVIPEVDQGNVRTVNDNASRSSGCVNALTLSALGGCGLSPLTTGSATYDATTRTLTILGNGRAILTGNNYSFCSIVVKGNGVLQVASSTGYVRIFLDDPDNCKKSDGTYVPGAGTISVTESGRILNCHLQTQPETLQIYAVGNANVATTQTIAGTNTLTGLLRQTACGISLSAVLGDPMMIIAPHSTVDIGSSTAISGQVAGEQVKLSGTASVNPINALANLDKLGGTSVLPLYEATDYVECTGLDFTELPSASPAQGC